MKIITLSLINIFFFVGICFSQQVKYQTFKAQMNLIGDKDGVNYQWENTNITAALDYRTGDFISRLKNTDFNQKNDNSSAIADTIEQREIILQGNFPIEAIINQKQIYAKYIVELELIIENELHNLNFTVEITRPGGDGQYRIFVLKGIIYNDETNFPSFVGFDNEITIILAFNALINI